GAMSNSTRAALAFMLLASWSCGGSDSTSISVSTAAVAFNAELGGPPPAAQTLHATFHGDGVVVGDPPEGGQPLGLSVGEIGHTSSTIDVSLRVLYVDAPGTRTTTLRFVTGKTDGSQIKFVDVQVSLTVSTP